jgi:hypothetical protein
MPEVWSTPPQGSFHEKVGSSSTDTYTLRDPSASRSTLLVVGGAPVTQSRGNRRGRLAEAARDPDPVTVAY